MTEPTIYKPSIYNSPTIYNTGANGGGGGGESWRDWYDELERLGYKISMVEFANTSLMSKFNINCKIVSKHTQILSSSNSNPYVICIFSNQGNDEYRPQVRVDQFTKNPNKAWVKFYQPFDVYGRVNKPFEWSEGQTLEYIASWDKNSISLSINGDIFNPSLVANVNNTWYTKKIFPIDNGFGDSQMYFYYKKIYDNDDNLIMNFIPVKRKVDGLLGVLETISGLFATGSNLSE